jgi:hypothetical protein
VLFFVMCVVLWLCLIVAPLPPGINPFEVNNHKNEKKREYSIESRPLFLCHVKIMN